MAANEALADEVLRRMAERFGRLNELLLRRADAEPGLAGMGTTLTVACSFGLDLILCHLGDSRAYLLREGELRQLTRDMTTAQLLVDAGLLSAAEAARHRLRHVLTQALGQDGKVTAQLAYLPLRDGDRLLLCSDGLTEMVEGGQIAGVLQAVAAPQEACQALVDRALAGGGRDNVTVVLADYRLSPGGAET
jgi:protein phosphatase